MWCVPLSERVVEGRTNDFGLGFVPHPLGLGGQTVNPHLPNLGILLDLGYLAVCMLKFWLFADFFLRVFCVYPLISPVPKRCFVIPQMG